MRDAAAQDHRVQHARALEIIDELAGTGEEAPILRAVDRLTDQRRGLQVQISNSPLISTGMPCGNSAIPTAERACWPFFGPSSS